MGKSARVSRAVYRPVALPGRMRRDFRKNDIAWIVDPAAFRDRTRVSSRDPAVPHTIRAFQPIQTRSTIPIGVQFRPGLFWGDSYETTIGNRIRVTCTRARWLVFGSRGSEGGGDSRRAIVRRQVRPARAQPSHRYSR